MKKMKKKDVQVTVSELKGMVMTGMSRVDPFDIKPAEIKLIHPLTKVGQLRDKDNKNPKPGQFFHTGTLQIIDGDTDSGVEGVGIACRIVCAAKEVVTTHFDNKEEEKEQYRVIGVMDSNDSLFSFIFSGQGIHSLGKLFTVVYSQEIPMFLFPITIESKYIEARFSFWKPVLRIGIADLKESERSAKLYDLAKRFDVKVRANPVSEDDNTAEMSTSSEISTPIDMSTSNEPKSEPLPFE